MNVSNNNGMIKALAFEKAIIEILKNDNKSLLENYSEKRHDYSRPPYRFQYDAVSFGSLNLQSFEMDTIYAKK